MKNNFHWLVLLFGCMSFMRMNAQMTFTHPGAVNSKADLDYVKAKIAAGEQPWLGKYNEVRAIANSGGITSPAPTSEGGQKSDGRTAYAAALVWYYSGEVQYANKAIGILNAWGNTFNGYASADGQNLLQGGWIGALLGPAAEIMRGYAGWALADRTKVQNMFKTRFYPVLNKMSTWNGNVDLTQIDAMMSIAVFCEDEAEFNLGIQRLKSRNPRYFYLSSEGMPANSGEWFAPTQWVNGLTQETCRDNNHHAQYAMASALHAAEVAWNQGVDVYAENTARYVATLELMAKQMLSGQMGTCANNTTTADLYATWEVGYNHYHNRKGINLPNTLQLLTTRVRANGASDWNIFYETLTHNSGATTTPVNQTPQVNITSPAGGASFASPASITIAANASDADGTISKVEFYNGTTLLGTDLSAPYSYLWTGVAAGSYSISAKAFDNSNAVANSTAINVTVTGVVANQAPQVNISSPINNASFTAPTSIAISANASDADGTISKVEFYNGATLLGTDLTAPYTFSFTGVAAGTYSLTAKAFDNLNATTSSAVISVVVANPVIGGACNSFDLNAAGWVFRNAWSDQGNGSVLSNDVAALKVSHRQWGQNFFWLISSAKYSFTAGTSYTISYDVMGSMAIASTEIGLATTYDNVAPQLAQLSTVAPAGYTVNVNSTKTVSVVAAASGLYQIALKINLVAQPAANASFWVNNFKYCGGTVAVNQAPQVSLTSPINNASFTAPANMVIAANASDADGTISKVEFYNGATLLGTSLASPYNFNWTAVAAGTYTITAKAYDNLNASTISAAVNLSVGNVVAGACTSLDLTSTAWVLRNSWSDQGNGSLLSNETGALKIAHRQWGQNYFWLVSSAKYALTAGTKYTISYDVMGSQSIASTEVGITTAIPNNDPALAQASVVAPAGYALNTYGSKSIVLTPTASGSYCIAIKINLSAQPPVVATFNIKNLKYCPPTGTFKTEISSSSEIAGDAGLKVYPNPAQNQLVLEYEGISKYEIYNIQGKLVLEGTIVNKQQVDISSVDSGMYLVIVANADGRAVQKVVKE
ncbi:MAG: Ig-like domain-containing protein [Bacteroidetes bacterium]|nr:Ig-like domain-containing protein [Bacteroidota bacterium]